jgi:hypothetical protein
VAPDASVDEAHRRAEHQAQLGVLSTVMPVAAWVPVLPARMPVSPVVRLQVVAQGQRELYSEPKVLQQAERAQACPAQRVLEHWELQAPLVLKRPALQQPEREPELLAEQRRPRAPKLPVPERPA